MRNLLLLFILILCASCRSNDKEESLPIQYGKWYLYKEEVTLTIGGGTTTSSNNYEGCSSKSNIQILTNNGHDAGNVTNIAGEIYESCNSISTVTGTYYDEPKILNLITYNNGQTKYYEYKVTFNNNEMILKYNEGTISRTIYCTK